MMNDRWQELQDDLQILALPVSFQMRLDVGDACRVCALSQPFASWNHHHSQQLHSQLTYEQAQVLSRLNMTLKHLCTLPDCSETTLRKHTGWRQVRWLARIVLLAFGWNLNLPSPGTAVYQQIKGEAIDEQFA